MLMLAHQGGHGSEDASNGDAEQVDARGFFDVQNGIDKEPNKAWIVRENDPNTKPTPYKDYPNPDAVPVAAIFRRTD